MKSLKKRWNLALKAEDCVKVRNLLIEDASLLYYPGWEAGVQASLQSKPRRVWKGCTALHIAARRGDANLVEAILSLNQEARGSARPNLLEIVDNFYELDALAMAVVNGNRAIVNKLKKASLGCSSNPYDIDKQGEDGLADDDKEDEGTSREALEKEKIGEKTTYKAASHDDSEINGALNKEDEGTSRDGLKEEGEKMAQETTSPVASKEITKEILEDCPYDIAEEADDKGLLKKEDEAASRDALKKMTTRILKRYIDKESKDTTKKDGGKGKYTLKKDDGAPSQDVLKEIAEQVRLNESSLIKEYGTDCNFNFLNPFIYFFHFTFSTGQTANANSIDTIFSIQKDIIKDARDSKILDYLLLKLRDGQGRTALHVAVDSQKVARFFQVMDNVDPQLSDYRFVNVRDSVGRTPLFRAAAQNKPDSVEDLVGDKRRTDATLRCQYEAEKWGTDVDIDRLSWRNNFQSDCVFTPLKKLQQKSFNIEGDAFGGPGPYIKPLEEISCTALHVALIHKRDKIVRQILKALSKELGSKNSATYAPCYRRFSWPVVAAQNGDVPASYEVQTSASSTQLSVLVGSIPILESLLEVQENEEKSKVSAALPSEEEKLPSFLLAAAMGKPEMIKVFLDRKDGKFNPRIKDGQRNTALHHALKGKHVEFHPHLVDFVSCHHVFLWRAANDGQISHWLANPEPETRKELTDVEKSYIERRKEKDKNVELKERYGQRRGSINLLLEAGLDLWEPNKEWRTARPEPDAPEKFVKWWYEKVAQDTQQEQQTLNAAANAVSVTAALVATASYVGPFTPPLGYGGDPLSVQVNLTAVRIFVVCDSLCFYLALSAIMLALVPSLPLPGMSMFRDLVRTRILFAMAASCLFPSIICVLIAFAAAYSAVIPDDGLTHHGLTVGTTVIGGFLCLLVTYIFAMRWVKVIRRLDRTEIRIFLEEVFTAALVGIVICIYRNTLGRCMKKDKA